MFFAIFHPNNGLLRSKLVIQKFKFVVYMTEGCTMQNTYQNPAAPQGDILSCGGPAAAPAIDGQNVNPNIWKPRGITPQNPIYKALVRQLPRGLEGLKKNLYPSVLVKTHFLKDPETGVKRTILCRESLPGQKCPICKKIALLYKQLVKEPGGKDAAVKRCKNYWADEHWYCNVLIKSDPQNADVVNTVKMWEHTPFVEKRLDRPCRVNPNAAAAPQQQPATDIFAQQLAQTQVKEEYFIPYDPRHGRDFFVMPVWNTETQRVDYSQCSWAQQASPLAPTDQEMLAILNEQCHDLNQLYADMPDEVAAEAAWNEFWQEVNDTRSTMGQPTLGGANPNQFAGGPNGFIPNAQAPFQMPGAPMNTVSGADYFGAAAPAASAAPANDPLAIGGTPVQQAAPAAQAADPFAGYQAPVQQAAPAAQTAPANDPFAGYQAPQKAAPVQQAAPANDPFAGYQAPAQQVAPAAQAAPAYRPAQQAAPAVAADPSQPVNDMLAIGSFAQPQAQAGGFGAAQQFAPQQTPAAPAAAAPTFAPPIQPPAAAAQPAFGQAPAAQMSTELPAAEDDIDLPF